MTEKFVKQKCQEYGLHNTTGTMSFQDNTICIVKIITINNIPTILFSATVQSDGSWSINVYDKVLKNPATIPLKFSLIA